MKVDRLRKAIEFAEVKHAGQKRKYTGEPYLVHLLAVANMVRLAGGSNDMVVAAVLHDTLEDTETTFVELEREFGAKVAGLVAELTDVFVSGSSHGNRAVRKAKERARLATVSADAQTIKVADMIDNTGSIVERDPDFAKLYLTEKAALLEVLTKADPALLEKARGS
jgi:(p)ppGpp synthase/HD superfamily hydrolase